MFLHQSAFYHLHILKYALDKKQNWIIVEKYLQNISTIAHSKTFLEPSETIR